MFAYVIVLGVRAEFNWGEADAESHSQTGA